jgi:hypothetical protein
MCSWPSGDSRAASASVTGCPAARCLHHGVDVAGVPEHHHVQHEAERAELVFLAFPVRLAQLAALPVKDLAGQPVPRLLNVQLSGDPPPVTLVDRVHHREQVQDLVDAAVLGERLPSGVGLPSRLIMRIRS